MNQVNRTLYIPLYGKALVSRRGILLQDARAEEIWERERFPLKGKSKSKWLAYYMAMRARVFDEWTKKQLSLDEQATVLHLGCGLDSRAVRVGMSGHAWYDVDFSEVIAVRREYDSEDGGYRMIGADIREDAWLTALPEGGPAIVVAEGVSMYLAPQELSKALQGISARFSSIKLLIDCYTPLAAKLSKYRNPVNDVGVRTVYGVADPTDISRATDLSFAREHEITPAWLIDELSGMEKFIFKRMYAGKIARKMYRLYEYRN